MSRASKLSVIALALVTGLVAGVAAYKFQRPPEDTFRGTDITGVQWARDFELTDHTGRVRRMADFRGKVVIVFFGYTNCPDACPTALAELAQVVKQLGSEGGRVQVLFITTDPARDTEQRLATYVTAFDPSFLGLRGNAEQTARVAKDFKVYFRSAAPKPDGHASHTDHGNTGYMVDHSTGILAFDREGRPRLYIGANGRSVDAMVHDIRLLLRS